ncbi:MAG: hypothetical protein ACPLSP_06770, partial [Fervidicoccus fontis]
SPTQSFVSIYLKVREASRFIFMFQEKQLSIMLTLFSQNAVQKTFIFFRRQIFKIVPSKTPK